MADPKDKQLTEDELLDKEIKLQKQLQKVIENERKQLETVYEWEAPERIYTPKSRRWFAYVGIIALVLIALSALTNNFILIFAIIALVVVLYTVYSVPPHKIKHQITNKGLYSMHTLFLWKNILTFWVTERDGEKLLHFEYKGRATDSFYRRMVLVLGKGNLKTIVAYIVQYIDYLGPTEIDQGILTKLADGNYIPIIDIVGDTDIATKDPNDSPTLIRLKERSK
jgi:hypothetical protein